MIVMVICNTLGPALPFLYLIGTIAIFVQYIMDRLELAFFYRLPPKYS
jgi:hypothetical protein